MGNRRVLTFTQTMIINALLVGIGVFTVLLFPSLRENLLYMLPAVILVSLVIAPFIAWILKPDTAFSARKPRHHKLMRPVNPPDDTIRNFD